MAVLTERRTMAKKKAVPDDRVTILNLKGSHEEKRVIDQCSEETGVPTSTIVRRGVAMWFKSRGYEPPKGWPGK